MPSLPECVRDLPATDRDDLARYAVINFDGRIVALGLTRLDAEAFSDSYNAVAIRPARMEPITMFLGTRRLPDRGPCFIAE